MQVYGCPKVICSLPFDQAGDENLGAKEMLDEVENWYRHEKDVDEIRALFQGYVDESILTMRKAVNDAFVDS